MLSRVFGVCSFGFLPNRFLFQTKCTAAVVAVSSNVQDCRQVEIGQQGRCKAGAQVAARRITGQAIRVLPVAASGVRFERLFPASSAPRG